MKFLLIVLVTLEAVLLAFLALTPANATVRDNELYTWGFTDLRSQELVCKRVSMTENDRFLSFSSEMNPVSLQSLVVDDHYCSHLAKPKF